ncbi:HpcH/HpaI aldolase/citrate lyase family protein [Dactylosporangium sucinum]|uniref:CoA ester lyase n=1 Tax=Dactylosporangium sucinum TaxID=1424081 RepID=A0A917TZG5_9ACTN|nr:CoA ester lyase [Dactylosporangium sucinum]GGM45909.1 CoA ester lyase [Dactylosporangium sucinum]
MTARSYLYVPGDAPAKLDRALSRGADALIVDLEDAVPPGGKAAARAAVAEWVTTVQPGDVEIWVRVNPGPLRDDDVRAVAAAPAVRGLVVAKCESPAEVEALDALLGSMGSSTAVVPLLESAAAVMRAPAIAAAPRVVRLQLGEADLRADLGVSPQGDERELLLVRSQIVLASAAAGIDPPAAPVSTDFTDLGALRASTTALARLGYVGRACIHPAQISVVNEVFTPGAEEVDRARDLIARFEAASGGVVVDARGRMVDEAVVRQARRLLARAAGHGA